MSISVVDATAKPVNGAKVTATNLGSGSVISLTTNGSGVATLTEEIGPGTVHVKAELNGKTSSTGQSEWTCAECDCAVNPSSLTLTLP